MADNKYGVTVALFYENYGKLKATLKEPKPGSKSPTLAEIADLIANGAGGQLIMEEPGQKQREAMGDKTPTYNLKFYTAEQVEARKEYIKSRSNGGGNSVGF